MKLKKIAIEQFGIWRDLEMRGLGDGLNIVFGPNEVGKTTLMQFVRSMLYGVTGDRRQRFFTSTGVDAASGVLELESGGDDAHRLAREFAFTDTGHSSDRVAVTRWLGGEPVERLAGEEGAEALSRLLGEIDEPTYTAVYAIGIRELQRLACLDDADSARLLYELSTGIRGSALHEIRDDVESTLSEIHTPGDETSLLARLWRERERLTRELAETNQSTTEYYDLCKERDDIQREIDSLEGKAKKLREQLRLIETCVNLHEIWDERTVVERELKSLSGIAYVAPEQIDLLAESRRRIGRLRTHMDRWHHEAEMSRQQVEEFDVNDALIDAAARIEALSAECDWIGQLHAELEVLDGDIDVLEEKLGPAAVAEVAADSSSPREYAVGDTLGFDAADAWKALKPVAQTWQQRRKRLAEARADVERIRGEESEEEDRIARAMLERDETDLDEALERTGARVSQLRRRVQADERLVQLAGRRNELENETEDSLEHQLLPMWALVVLGSLFVGGVAMILAGTLGSFTDMLSFGWSHAGLGLLAVGISGGAMLWMQRSARLRLEDCQKQIDMISVQMRQAEEERAELDAQLPRGRGPLTVRLQEAERELADLEALVPIEARRKASADEATAAEERLEWAREEVRETHEEWLEALAEYGLPADLTPKRLRGYLSERRRQGHTQGQLARLYRDRDARRAELAEFGRRVAGVYDDCGLKRHDEDPVRGLEWLGQQLERQQHLAQQRDELTERLEQSEEDCRRAARLKRRLGRRIRALLREVGAEDEAEFESIVRKSQRRVQLEERFNDIDRTLSAAIGDGVSEEDVRARLKKQDNNALEADWERVGEKSQQLEDRLKLLWQSHGKVVEQLETLGRSPQAGRKRLELEVVEHQLRQQAHRWKVLSVACRLFDRVRRSYERDRQPVTLGRATEYFARLTDGRYQHVWTPLDEDVLKADDARGRTWPVETLSRGTREQLFLALRLALVDYYVERGIHLPVVLDDVLVNFDNQRALAAAELLRDFAAANRQVVLLTCHDHIREMFAALGVDVFDLPADSEPGAIVEPSRTRRRVVQPVPLIEAPVEVEEPVVAEDPAVAENPVEEAEPIEVAEDAAEPTDDGELYEVNEPVAVRQPTVMSFDAQTEPELDVQREPEAETEPPSQPVVEPVHHDDGESRRLRLRRYWRGGGAEEFAGEFTERVVRYVGTGDGVVVEQLYQPDTTIIETVVDEVRLANNRTKRRSATSDETNEASDQLDVEAGEAA